MSTNEKEYNSLDIFKFVLSIFVLIIHSEIDKTVISPLLRIAVPSFFIISSYLFFFKISNLTDEKSRKTALARMIKRNVYLYIFWVVIQLPLIIYGRHYHINFFTEGIWNTLKDIFLGKAFTGSWYIIALVIGNVLVYYASKKISAVWIVVLALPVYIMCCFTTNYRGVFATDSFLIQFNTAYENVTQCIFNTSLPGGLFWIAVGNWLARKTLCIKSRTLNILLIFFAVLILIERYFIVRFGWQYLDDCYFTLMLLCPTLFLIIKQHNFTFKSRFQFREMSTLIFVIHGSCGRITGYMLKKVSFELLHNEIFKVCITLVLALIAGIIFLKLREKLKIKILKYSC